MDSKYEMEKGFTLLEVLISIVMSIIVTYFAYETLGRQNYLRVDEAQKVNMQQSGRAVIQILGSGMKMAGYAPKVPIDGAILEARADRFSYYWDQNGNGSIDAATDVVEFYFEDNELKRCVGGQCDTLVSSVAALTMLYAWDNESFGDQGYGDLEPEDKSTYWGVDTVGDGWLNTHFTEADLMKRPLEMSALTVQSPVSIQKVRAVKIWLLLESERDQFIDLPLDSESIVSVMPNASGLGANPLNNCTVLDSVKAYRLFHSSVKLRNMYF